MLCILSPAKSLDLETPPRTDTYTEATFPNESQRLINLLRTQTPDKIGDLMGISQKLASLNHERYLDWEQAKKPSTQARPAVISFNGDVYKGLEANKNFTPEDFNYAQKTLRILSGLYGLLRPLDLIMPYRLEMGTKLEIETHKNLYQFWGHKITDALRESINESPGEQALLNLASKEYFKAVKKKALAIPIIEPKFLDSKNGKDYKVISFFAKRARGSMTSWIIKNRIESLTEIKSFTGMGYRYDSQESTEEQPVFTRVQSCQ